MVFNDITKDVDNSRKPAKGRFTQYDFHLRLFHAIFIARHRKIVHNFYAIKLPVAKIVIGF